MRLRDRKVRRKKDDLVSAGLIQRKGRSWVRVKKGRRGRESESSKSLFGYIVNYVSNYVFEQLLFFLGFLLRNM